MQQYSFSELDGYMFLFTHSGHGIIEVAGDSRNLQRGDLLFWDCQDFIQMRALTADWNIDILFFNGAAVTTYYEEICKITFPLFKYRRVLCPNVVLPRLWHSAQSLHRIMPFLPTSC